MTKKKRVIKVPKAANGLESAGSSLQNSLYNNWQANMTNQLFANQTAGIKSDLANSSRMMQLKADMATGNPLGATNFNNGTNINQFNTTTGRSGAWLSTAAGLLQSAPKAIDLLASPFQTSDATSGKEATMQSIEGVAKGIGTGAQIGMNFGPMGAVVGAAAGALTGLVGKKGREAGMTSFTDYDEGTLGTGLIGAFSNKKLRKRRRQVKMNALNNKAAVAGTEYLQNEYAEENGDYTTNTFAQGGSIPSSLAYVDDGELISTPDGTVSKVPEQGKPVDSNLVSLPEGSRVLSNTLKVPGTNKTFAQLGEEMMTKRKSKGKDRFAQNAATLNEMNNKQIHDQLFAQQEAIKAKRGSKKEYKNLVEEFQTGGEKGYTYRYNPVTGTFDYVKTSNTTSSDPNSDYWYNTENAGIYTFQQNNPRYSEIFMGPVQPERIQTVTRDESIGPPEFTPIQRISRPNRSTNTTTASTQQTAQQTTQQPIQSVTISTPPQIEQPLDYIDVDHEVQRTYISPYRPKDDSSNTNSPDLLGVLSGIAGLAPIMSNLFTARPEAVRANYNPYQTTISNAMRRRRFDINPAIQDITRNRAISDYNASQLNTNTGANMAYRLQSAIARNNAIADLRSQESNVNNQYLGEYANMMNNLGQQFVAANNLADDLNAQNRATARNIRRAGLSQLSGWFQNRELMRNYRDRDRAMLKMYDPLLKSVLPSADYTSLMQYFNR